jgi:hypothetical protein
MSSHRCTHRAQTQEADPFHVRILGAGGAVRQLAGGRSTVTTGTERVTPDPDG